MADTASTIARKLHVAVICDHLVRETPFEKVSVNQICEASGGAALVILQALCR